MLTHLHEVVIKLHSTFQKTTYFFFLCARILSFFHLAGNSDTVVSEKSAYFSAKFSVSKTGTVFKNRFDDIGATEK